MSRSSARCLFDDDDIVFNEKINKTLEKQQQEKEIDGQYVELNHEMKKDILDFLQSFARDLGSQSSKKILIVKGPLGCGKTTLIMRCIAEANYDFVDYYPDSQEVYTKFSESSLGRLISLGSMGSYIDSSARPLVVLIKDFDNTLKSYQEVFEYVNKEPKSKPMILVTNNMKFKKPARHNNMLTEVIMRPYTSDEILQICRLTRPLESHAKLTDKIIKELAEKCNGDIRQVLESLSIGLLTSFRDFKYEISKTLQLIKDGPLDEVLDMCSLYTNSVVFANVYGWSKKVTSKKGNDNSLSEISQIIDSISESHIIDGYIRSINCWDDYCITNSSCILGTIAPIRKLERLGAANGAKFAINVTKKVDEDLEDIEESSEGLVYEKGSNMKVFDKLDELQYILRYIIRPVDYLEFIETYHVRYQDISLLCSVLDKPSADLFKKAHKAYRKKRSEEFSVEM
jgi:DNA polymerase III delta prime subunit